MPKGVYPRKPRPLGRSYSTEMIDTVRQMYEAGHTQREIATAINSTQRIVYRLMKVHGIEARPSQPRNRWGSDNPNWRGSNASYGAWHRRVIRAKGQPSQCSRCGTSEPDIRYEWANLTGNYEDPDDYERMCIRCHNDYDGMRRRTLGVPTSPYRRDIEEWRSQIQRRLAAQTPKSGGTS